MTRDGPVTTPGRDHPARLPGHTHTRRTGRLRDTTPNHPSRQHRATTRSPEPSGRPQARFGDLGADHYDARSNKHRRARNLAAQLQAVTGQRIMIRNGKAVIVEPEAA
jgi:hypothetical protein